ncbi:hypothetical protein C8K30_11486 [Promicromonospora sp. AC04]|uniref:hypothetical protein n=1 Tax=Promicromonospora sp. AC04 TaxID=2135723 RepID=UPI000D3D88AA|nr:hypothetical protein [Promicromonospora sp. AC04]PUB21543.1 hypothetical protein C8K30_11486 [Promicromonospora sp. AC04]
MTVVTVSSETSTDADADDAVADTRHAQALAALRSAEARTGVRKQATVARAVQPVRTEHTEQARTEQARTEQRRAEQARIEQSRVPVRALRGGLTAGPATEPAPSGSRAGAGGPGEEARVLPVHPHLAALLPDGGLRAGTTVMVRGSTSLLLTLLAEASRDGAWTVLVGYPAAGMAAAADAGCDLARTLVVPLPAGSGVDAPAVLAALIDGMDVVVVGPGVALLDHDRRRLSARARERGTVLVPALPAPALSAGSSTLRRPLAGRGSSTRRGVGDNGWPGAQVVLEAVGGGWAGIDHGTGWLRRRTLRVRRTGRGSAARPLHLDVEVPVCRAAGGAELADGLVSTATSAVTAVTRAEAPDSATESRPQLELVG